MSAIFGSLKTERDAWKRDTLFGRYTPEQLDYRRFKKKRRADEDTGADPVRPARNPPNPRFEGMWVVGLPGSGKTQLFQYLISRDLDMVARGGASVVVLDPTGDEAEPTPTLIRNLTRLRRFAPGGDLYGKLIYIDPTDEDYILPINLLSLRPNLNDRAAISSAIKTYRSISTGSWSSLSRPFRTRHSDTPFRSHSR